MALPRSAALTRCLIALAAIASMARMARAQEQERKLLDRIMHPNMDLHFDGFDKSFDTKASNRDKTAVVRPFNFGGRTAGLKGDGAFHAKTFNDGRGNFATTNFSTNSAAIADRQASQVDRAFATRSVEVREDRVANKGASIREFVNAEKPFLVPGKRQDSIDELRTQKNLTVEQIREILNKSR